MRTFLLCLIIWLPKYTYAQLESSHWFTYNNHSLVTPSGVTLGLPLPAFSENFYSYFKTSSVSDKDGNLLMATNGITIINKNLQRMPTLASVNFGGGGNKTAIQQIPGTNRYYVFYLLLNSSSLNRSGTLKYAEVDMDGNGGDGSVLSYDNIVAVNLSTTYTLAQGDDPSQTWLVTHKYETDSFYVYPITSSGLSNTAVISRTGNAVLQDYIFREMKTSFDGKLIAGVAARNYPAIFSSTIFFVEVFEFNNLTGKLTARVKSRRENQYPYHPYRSIEFSADNRLLYLVSNLSVYGLQPCGFGAGNIKQYNLCYTDSSDFSKYAYTTFAGAYFCAENAAWDGIQMGADKKLHIPFGNGAVSTVTHNNRIGFYTEFSQYGYQLPNSIGQRSIPDQHHKMVERAIKNNIVYDGGCFPSPINFKITNDTITRVEWNFGDAASPNNTSTSLNPSHVFSAPGIYTVKASLYNSSNVLIDTLSELVQSKDPDIRLLHQYPTDTTFCSGSSLTITLPQVVNGIYYWYQNIGYEAGWGTTNSINISSTGKYYVQLKLNDCNGCTMIDSIDVTVLPKPFVDFGNDRIVCAGDSTQLIYYDNDAAVLWSTGATTHSIWVKDAGLYWMQAEYDNNGCVTRDSINITVVPALQFALPGDTTLCDGQTLLLNPGVNNAGYQWQNGSTQPTYTVQAPGIYWVQITSNGCSKRDSIVVNYATAQNINLGRDTTLCNGQNLQLSVIAPASQISWSTGEIGNSIQVNTGGSYWVKVNNGSCIITDTIQVSFITPPVFSLGKDTTVCNGHTLLLQPNITGATYSWQDGSAQPSYLVTQPGLYWLQASVIPGCSLRDSITVSYAAAPSLALGADTALCIGNSLVLQAGPGPAQYTWSTGEVSSAITVSQSGTYWVNVNNGNCAVRDTINVTFNQPPLLSLGADTTLCAGEKLLLSTTVNNAQYLWQNGSISNSFTISQPGIYWLEILKGGCKVRDSINVSYTIATPFSLGVDKGFCEGEGLTLNAPAGFTQYIWNTGSSASSINISQPGNYWLQAVNQYNCTVKDTIRILAPYPLPVVNLGPDVDICKGSQKSLSAAPGAMSYTWSTGAATSSIAVTQPGTYWVSATSAQGCKRADTILIKSLLALPTGYLGRDTAICNYGTIDLKTLQSFKQYTWSTGSTMPNISITQPGWYWLQVTDANNCRGIDSIKVDLKNCLSGLYVPSAFTPNGDGKNDYLKAMLFANIHAFELQVYNRYGQLVFNTKNPAHGWDGRVKGIAQETGSFVWICRYKINNEAERVENGTTTLIR